MKKHLIAKLLVLAMVLSMLPVAAMAAESDATDTSVSNDAYYSVGDDTNRPGSSSSGSGSTGSTTVEVSASAVTTTTDASGQTIAKTEVKATVTGNTANVSLSASAVSTLASQAASSNASAVVLTVDSGSASKAVVSAPASALKEIAAAGADLTVQSKVADVTVPSEALAALPEGTQNVEVSAQANSDGTYAVGMSADGKLLEDIPGGLAVSLNVSVTEDQVAGVFLIKLDKSENELSFTISAGRLNVTLTSSGTVRIDKK